MKILVLEERLSGETLRCCTPNTHKYIPALIGTHFSNIKMPYLFLKNTLVRKKYIYIFLSVSLLKFCPGLHHRTLQMRWGFVMWWRTVAKKV